VTICIGYRVTSSCFSTLQLSSELQISSTLASTWQKTSQVINPWQQDNHLRVTMSSGYNRVFNSEWILFWTNDEKNAQKKVDSGRLKCADNNSSQPDNCESSSDTVCNHKRMSVFAFISWRASCTSACQSATGHSRGSINFTLILNGQLIYSRKMLPQVTLVNQHAALAPSSWSDSQLLRQAWKPSVNELFVLCPQGIHCTWKKYVRHCA